MFARRKEFREHKIITDASLKAMTDRLESYNRGSNEFYLSSLKQKQGVLGGKPKDPRDLC